MEFNQYQPSFVPSLLRRTAAILSRKRLMLRVKRFHTHTRILHVTTATTTPAAMTPASWFMGCERVMGWRWGVGCYFMIMLSLCTSTNEGSEMVRWEAKERRDRLLCTHVGVFFLSDTVLLFQSTSCTCRQTVIFIVIIALNLRVHLWKGSNTQRNSSVSWWIRISIMPLAENYKSLRTVYNSYEQIRQHVFLHLSVN